MGELIAVFFALYDEEKTYILAFSQPWRARFCICSSQVLVGQPVAWVGCLSIIPNPRVGYLELPEATAFKSDRHDVRRTEASVKTAWVVEHYGVPAVKFGLRFLCGILYDRDIAGSFDCDS